MDLSIVIPLLNEAPSLPELAEWINKVMQQYPYVYEVIFVDDGSNDGSWETIEELKKKYPFIRGIKFRRNYGKSAALNVGFASAKGTIVLTMDADLQDSPEEIPQLVRRIQEENLDLIAGWKAKRYDPLSKTIPTKLFNAIIRSISGIKQLHDFNCGLKAYRQVLVKSIEVYGEMHRYIPVIAKWAGFTRIAEQVVAHKARKYGKSKFGSSRFIKGFLDLLSIFFVGKFSRRPMHFFGSIGVLSFIAGLLVTTWLIIEKLHSIAKSIPYRSITETPLFYIALVAIIIGCQLFLTGFLAELISRSNPERNKYQIDKMI